MKFDGQNYRKTNDVVTLPFIHNEGELRNYQAFGRVCKPSERDAIQTNFSWRGEPPALVNEENYPMVNDRYPVFARKIPSDGYSLTNLMYGADRKMYLAYDGKVYVRSRIKHKVKIAPAPETPATPQMTQTVVLTVPILPGGNPRPSKIGQLSCVGEAMAAIRAVLDEAGRYHDFDTTAAEANAIIESARCLETALHSAFSRIDVR